MSSEGLQLFSLSFGFMCCVLSIMVQRDDTTQQTPIPPFGLIISKVVIVLLSRPPSLVPPHFLALHLCHKKALFALSHNPLKLSHSIKPLSVWPNSWCLISVIPACVLGCCVGCEALHKAASTKLLTLARLLSVDLWNTLSRFCSSEGSGLCGMEFTEGCVMWLRWPHIIIRLWASSSFFSLQKLKNGSVQIIQFWVLVRFYL